MGIIQLGTIGLHCSFHWAPLGDILSMHANTPGITLRLSLGINERQCKPLSGINQAIIGNSRHNRWQQFRPSSALFHWAPLASFHWASLGGISLHANTPGNNSRHHRLQCTTSLGNTARQHLWPSSIPCHYSAPILPISGFKFVTIRLQF